MLLVPIFVLAASWATAHEFPRGGRVKFPYEGPPPPPLSPFGPEIYLGPRIYGAESQSRPVVFHEPAPTHEFNMNNPYKILAQKPTNANPFGDIGPHGFAEGLITKPYINQHRSPSRPREAQFHETQPPPFAHSIVPQSTKVKGVLNAPPPQPTPSLSSALENEPQQHQRHRFGGLREPSHPGRRPSTPRKPSQHGNDRHPQPSNHYESQPIERYPPLGDAPERPRTNQDRPANTGDRYHTAERNPSSLEKPLSYKEKARVPFVGKKPLFNPTPNEKFPPKVSARPTFEPQVNDYSSPESAQEDEYYHTKLKDEYYSALQPTAFSDPAPTRAQGNGNGQRSSGQKSNPQQAYEFNEGSNFGKDAFNIPNFSQIELGKPFPGSPFPHSEEFKDFFETSIPEWMNDFKNPPAENAFNAGVPPKSNQKLKSQETRQKSHQPQSQQFSHPELQSFVQGQNRNVKRNPVLKQQDGGYSGQDDYDDRQSYQKPRGNAYGDERQQSGSYYESPESTEFDFGSTSDFKDFNGWFSDLGGTQSKTGNEWIPINAPGGTVPAKSYDIPAPDLSKEYFQSSSQYDSGEYQQQHNPTPPPRRASPRVEKSRETSNVVYGARETTRHGSRGDKGRQSEGVVSASLTVKQ